MTDFQQAVVALLRKNYPDALILTEEAEGGFSAPGFIVLVGEASLKKEMGRRWRRQETVVVWYYPAAGGQPQDLEQPLPGSRPGLNGNRADSRYSCFCPRFCLWMRRKRP